MKRFLVVLLCFLFAYPLCAEGYKRGDMVSGIALNTAYPDLGLWKGEFNVNDITTQHYHDAKLGKLSFGGAIQTVYFLAKNFAVGIHLSSDFFSKEIASGVEREVGTSVRNYMLLARYYLNPQAKIKYYIPIALGAADTIVTVKMTGNERFHYTGFAAHLGFGAEYYFKKNVGIGGEIRYNHNVFHDTKVTHEGHYMEIYPRANYVSYSMQLFRKF